VGVWGTNLFADDAACDVREHYRALLEDGVADEEATRLTIEAFSAYFEEADGVAVLALAVTQSKLGRLDPDIRDRALAAIDRGADLESWQDDNPKLLPKRRAMLEKARAQLTGPQPVRKRLRPPTRASSGLAAGDVLALTLPQRVVLLRVVRVREHRRGENPVLEELDFDGPDVPAQNVLERLPPKTRDPVTFMHALSADTRFFAFVMQRIDWKAAGFVKALTISTRAGDVDAPLPSSGISWAELAKRFHRRSGQ
jgi:hypothetical protein